VSQTKGYLLVLASAALWATAAILARLLYDYGFTPYSAVFGQTSIAFVLAVAIALAFRHADLRVALKDLPFFASFGLVGNAILPVFYYQSLALTTVATAVVLLNTAPIFTILLARVVYRERLTARKATALALATAGTVLVVGLYQPGNLLVKPGGVV
jgi:drug/metabolite transporter (DMT)-like permease